MNGDRFLEDLEATMLARQPRDQAISPEQALFYSKVTLIDGPWRFTVSPILVANDFWIGSAQERVFLFLFGSQISMQVSAHERRITPRRTKLELADWMREFDGLRFRVFCIDGDFEGDVLHFDFETKQVQIEDSSVGGFTRISICKVRCIEISLSESLCA